KNLFTHSLTAIDYFVSGETFEIKQCTGCGLKFTADAEDEAGIDKYYQSENYISHSDTEKGPVNTIYHLIRRYMLNQKRRIVEHTTGKRNGTLLEVGAGTGYFLKKMRKHGWQIAGTEKNSNAQQTAKNKFNIELSQ